VEFREIGKAKLAPQALVPAAEVKGCEQGNLMVVDAVSNEKGVDKEIIFEALEAALASATRKKYGEESMRAWRSTARRATTTPSAAGRYSPTIPPSSRSRSASCGSRMAAISIPTVEPGGFVEQPMESVAFGRIAAQQAKQVIVQKVREAERAQVVEQYRDRVGTARERRRQARRSQRHLCRSRQQRRRVRAAHRHDSARTGEAPGPRQGVS
jgi:hypothetical protein